MPNIIEITDLNSPELDVFVRLTGAQLRNKLESEKGIFIAESPTVIEVALGSGCIPVSFLTDERLIHGDAVSRILAKCEKITPNMPTYTASREVLKELTGFELTRGALSAMLRPAPKSAEEVTRGAK